MKISLNWLQRYVDLEASAQELEQTLPMIGHEVESVEETGLPQIDKLVVGEVLQRDQHPDADKLGVCKVDAGQGEPLQIVCGASNYKVGDRVPVALVGAELPGGFKIKPAKLRGVESSGMMCSAKELGLGEDHSGLMILSNRPEIGKPMNEVYTDSDTVLDLELTANRGDCASHIGVARELAAYYGKPLKLPSIKTPADTTSTKPENFCIELQSPDCPYYTGWSIKGVKIGPSPDWLRRDLEAVGLRPINNVVDVTNWVLMATGQPLHAFDTAKIKGGKIIVRQANEGETITTLDERKHTLDPAVMVIADGDRPLVLAGIMGSLDAEVDDSTVDIFLESAWFKPGSVRATARKLGIHTDSSYRFARDVDPEGVETAARLVIDLILETAGGELVAPGLVAGSAPRGDNTINISAGFVRERTGYDIADAEIEDIFTRLGFTVEGTGENWTVTVPSVRGEVARPIDLVEEFVRIYGTEKIPEVPVVAAGIDRKDDAIAELDRKLAAQLVGQRFFECTHYSLRDAETITKWFPEAGEEPLGLLNPLASDQSHLRPSLLPGLLDALQLNHNRGNDAPRLFETGRVFRTGKNGVQELHSVAFVLRQDSESRNWLPREKPDFYTAKGIIENLATIAGVKSYDWKAAAGIASWQDQHAAFVGDWAQRGYQLNCGFINVAMLKQWDIDGLVVAGELLLRPDYINKPRKQPKIEELSNFPSTARDLAVLVGKDIPADKVKADLAKIAKKACGKEFGLEDVFIFDVYSGKGMAENQKSLALSMTFRAPERTLKDKEVAKAFDQIQEQMKAKGYEIRG